MSKRNLFAICLSVSIYILLSCKHEIPEPPAGNEPGTNEPVTQKNCSPDTAYFQQQVLPVFISNCSSSGCHDNASREGDVVLTSYSSIMSTGGIKPGNPGSSKVYKSITEQNDGDRMPPKPRNRLSTEQINLIYKWIAQGAKNNACIAAVCDTALVTFTTSVKPIITNKCHGCHSSADAQGGIDLSTFNGVKTTVLNGKLWGSINHMNGFSAMPKGGAKLSECEIAKFKLWIDAGALNN